ncbi:hypothetical protein ACA910_014661 [Epithemia clementina (nom. ined.)]
MMPRHSCHNDGGRRPNPGGSSDTSSIRAQRPSCHQCCQFPPNTTATIASTRLSKRIYGGLKRAMLQQQQQPNRMQSKAGFLPQGNRHLSLFMSGSSNLPDYLNDDIARLKARASLELQKAKAKIESKNAAKQQQTQANSTEDIRVKTAAVVTPFFASMDTTTTAKSSSTTASTATAAPLQDRRRQSVIKAVDQVTGLITADGEKMAALSEQEEWQLRSLLDVFETELVVNMDDTPLARSSASKQLAKRDVAASIWNLRRHLQTDDYRRIFDPKNRFIGETD